MIRPAAILLCALAFVLPARAQTLEQALLGGRPVADIRLRYESVSDESRAFTGAGATLRARLGYDTAAWNGLALSASFDILAPVGDTAYNTTRNGKTQYAQIGDTPLVALKHLNLTYAGHDTRVTLGRQRLALGSQRFLASPDWRMHGSSFDAVQIVNTAIADLALTYIYIDRANRIYGETVPFDVAASAAATTQAGYYDSDSHVMSAAWTGLAGLRLEAYALLLDFKPPHYAVSAAQRTANARLATATWGGRAEYDVALTGGLRARLVADHARQTPYAGNPQTFELAYWLGEAGLNWNGYGAALGYEVLSGNGTVALSTPLGWLHNNNGWADLFTTTPVNGLADLYVRGTKSWPGVLGMRSLNTTIAWHGFRTDRLGVGLGSEWDAQAELQIDGNFSVVLKYADYQGSGIGFGGAPDKSVFWLQTAWRY